MLMYTTEKKVKIKKKSNGEFDKSQGFYTDKCFVSVNPDKCVLIQVIPKK